MQSKSIADFINKLKIVKEELDESLHFLDLLKYFNKNKEGIIDRIEKEGNELLSIIVSSIKTMKNKISNK